MLQNNGSQLKLHPGFAVHQWPFFFSFFLIFWPHNEHKNDSGAANENGAVNQARYSPCLSTTRGHGPGHGHAFVCNPTCAPVGSVVHVCRCVQALQAEPCMWWHQHELQPCTHRDAQMCAHQQAVTSAATGEGFICTMCQLCMQLLPLQHSFLAGHAETHGK